MDIRSHYHYEDQVKIFVDANILVGNRFSVGVSWLQAQQPENLADIKPEYQPMLRDLGICDEVQEIWIDGTVITIIVFPRYKGNDCEESVVATVAKYPLAAPSEQVGPGISYKRFRFGG